MMIFKLIQQREVVWLVGGRYCVMYCTVALWGV